MTTIRNFFAAAALTAAVAAAPATATTTVTGAIRFGANSANYFDKSQGYVPAGYANATSSAVEASYGNGFGFQDAANTNTVTFFNTALTIKDVSSQMGASSFVMSFTADTAGFFDHAVISYDTFGGSLSLVGNTLTYSAPATGLAGTRMVTIMFQGISAVPEAGTWVLMLTGFGAIAVAMRRQRRSATPSVRVVFA